MPETAQPQQTRQPKSQDLLQTQLQRLLRVKEELWQECQPIPPELLAKIVEVERQLTAVTIR